jgi:hypothetical protein
MRWPDRMQFSHTFRSLARENTPTARPPICAHLVFAIAQTADQLLCIDRWMEDPRRS